MKASITVDNRFIYKEVKQLTVCKTSLFFANDGFTVYDCKGQLVFRVDSYGPGDRGEIVLMDAHGSCLITVRKKRPSLHHRWEGHLGDGSDAKKPVFTVRRSSIIGRCSMTVEVHGNPGEEYQIEGSFGQRKCTIYDAEKKPVAEIRRKVDLSTNVVLGKEVFSLWLQTGFDAAFAMALVLIIDQTNGDDYVESGQAVVQPILED